MSEYFRHVSAAYASELLRTDLHPFDRNAILIARRNLHAAHNDLYALPLTLSTRCALLFAL